MKNKETPIKEWLLTYVGEQKSPKNDEVTTEMIVDCVAKEFPEFLMLVAEENWVRGYKQALVDVDYGRSAENNENLQTI